MREADGDETGTAAGVVGRDARRELPGRRRPGGMVTESESADVGVVVGAGRMGMTPRDQLSIPSLWGSGELEIVSTLLMIKHINCPQMCECVNRDGSLILRW